MERLLDTTVVLRVMLVVSNLWLVGGLRQIVVEPASLHSKMYMIAFAFFGSVAILGAGLILRALLEHLTVRKAGILRAQRPSPVQRLAHRRRFPGKAI